MSGESGIQGKPEAEEPGTMDVEAHAERMVAYYRRLAAEEPLDPHWKHGLAAAERWLALIRDSHASRDAIQALIEELDAGMTDAGSGWMDMQMSARAWARLRLGTES